MIFLDSQDQFLYIDTTPEMVYDRSTSTTIRMNGNLPNGDKLMDIVSGLLFCIQSTYVEVFTVRGANNIFPSSIPSANKSSSAV
jgi:hypothetical protein